MMRPGFDGQRFQRDGALGRGEGSHDAPVEVRIFVRNLAGVRDEKRVGIGFARRRHAGQRDEPLEVVMVRASERSLQ